MTIKFQHWLWQRDIPSLFSRTYLVLLTSIQQMLLSSSMALSFGMSKSFVAHKIQRTGAVGCPICASAATVGQPNKSRHAVSELPPPPDRLLTLLLCTDCSLGRVECHSSLQQCNESYAFRLDWFNVTIGAGFRTSPRISGSVRYGCPLQGFHN